jgi:hypothetical protein
MTDTTMRSTSVWINVIDYRGDDTVINSRGDSLFNYRTKYFLRIQEDFHIWKQWGHKFRCFTKHKRCEHHTEFDDVIEIPMMNVPQTRNLILDYYDKNTWIGMWENDATLYWDRLHSRRVPKELDYICKLADDQKIIAWVPFNPHQSPYQEIGDEWTFKPSINLKGTMVFHKITDMRFDETFDILDDVEYACHLTAQGMKSAQLEQMSLREVVNGKSTIFKVNAYHEQYKNPGAKANPKGLLKWDAQLDRNERYVIGKEKIKLKHGADLKEISNNQRKLWKQPNNLFDKLFQDATN